MAKKNVFVSFDFDNDRALKDFILGQAKLADSPFNVTDHSLKETAPERDWETHARAAIGRCELVLVMVGPQTHKAQGVRKEVAMARGPASSPFKSSGTPVATTHRFQALVGCMRGIGRT